MVSLLKVIYSRKERRDIRFSVAAAFIVCPGETAALLPSARREAADRRTRRLGRVTRTECIGLRTEESDDISELGSPL